MAPTDNQSNSYTALTSYAASTFYYVQLFYKCGPTVSSSHTFTAHGSSPKIEVSLYSGTPTSSCLDTSSGTAGGYSNAWQPGSITPAQSGELFVTGFAYGATGTASISGSFNILDTLTNDGWLGTDAYYVNAGSTAQNPTWSESASTYGVTSMAAFKHP